MSKDSDKKEAQNEEIDLLDLFRKAGKAIAKWILALGNGLITAMVFLIRNSLPLALSVVLGVGLSYFVKWITKPEFRSEITLRSNTIPNAEMIDYINKLGVQVKDKNYKAIEKALGLAPQNGSAIKKVEAFWIIDKNKDQIPDYVDYKNRHNVYDTLNLKMQDRFAVRVLLTNTGLLPEIRDGFNTYVVQNDVFQQKNEFRLSKADELLTRIVYDINQLDSLQKVKYFEETRKMVPDKGGQIIFVQEQKTQLVYEDIYTLYDKKQILDQEKLIYPDLLTVLSDFYPALKRYNGGSFYGEIIIPVVFGLTLIYLILFRNRKKIQDLYKRF